MEVTITGLFSLAGPRASTRAIRRVLMGGYEVALGVLQNKRLGVPPLYRAGVRYEREKKPGYECWLDPYTTWKQGWGDCDDLAMWRAAELTLGKGMHGKRIKAIPLLVVQSFSPAKFHVVVGTPSGKFLDDPSKRLGMR